MEINYYGGNCLKIASKKSSIIIDDNLASLGQKSITTAKDIAIFTSDELKPSDQGIKTYFTVDGPGEYEVANVSITGIAAKNHHDSGEAKNSTMYRIILDDVRIAVVGHIHPDISEQQLEAFGTVDVLFVPVGGNGYTLDGIGAQKVIKEIEPKVVIPTHYADAGLNYEVPQNDLLAALKELAVEPSETLDSLKTKNLDSPDGVKLIVINRS